MMACDVIDHQHEAWDHIYTDEPGSVISDALAAFHVRN